MALPLLQQRHSSASLHILPSPCLVALLLLSSLLGSYGGRTMPQPETIAAAARLLQARSSSPPSTSIPVLDPIPTFTTKTTTSLKSIFPAPATQTVTLTNGTVVNIVGGTHPAGGIYFWQVLVVTNLGPVPGMPGYSNIVTCGGTLIDNLWVFTAAHCVTDEATDAVFPVSKMTVSADAGQSSFNSLVNCASCRVNVAQIFRHEQWNTLSITNDIALLRLASAFPASLKAQPILISTDMSPQAAGRDSYQSGYGKSGPSSDAINLQSAVMNVVSGGCHGAIVNNKQICIGCPVSPQVCNGDSGGPGVVPTASCPVVETATSYGFSASCNEASVFTRIPAFRNWIESKVGKSLASPRPTVPTTTCDSCAGPSSCPSQFYTAATCQSEITARPTWPVITQTLFACLVSPCPLPPNCPAPRFRYFSKINHNLFPGTVYITRARYIPQETPGMQTIGGIVMGTGLGGTGLQTLGPFPSADLLGSGKSIVWPQAAADPTCGAGYSYQTILITDSGLILQSLVYHSKVP